MFKKKHDIGVIKELLDRFNHFHLPRVLDIKDRVENGEKLLQSDIDFLIVVVSDSQNMRTLLERNPEYKPLAAKISHFYFEVIEIAIENESDNS